MKTPWRFLADLTSRRKPSAKTQSLPGPLEKPQEPASVAHPAAAAAEIADGQQKLEVPATAGEAADARAPSARVLKTAPLSPPAGDDLVVEADAARPGVSAQSSDKEPKASLPRALRTKTTKPAKPSGLSAEPQIVAATHGDRSALLLPSRGSALLDDVAGLDNEISQLRAALAQKLSLQNAQLRMMLKRFNVS